MKRPIPLNLQALYADLAQQLPDDPPASISRRMKGGKLRLHAVHPGGHQESIGTVGEAEAEAKAAAFRAAAGRTRARRKIITALKAAGVPTPDPIASRVLSAMARNGLFEKGAVVVGTIAYQLYPIIVGDRLTMSSMYSRDVDVAVARIAIPGMASLPPMDAILREVDASFAPKFHVEQKQPSTFRDASGYKVEVLTTPGRPVTLRGLDCGAEPLAFMDYLIEDAMPVVALIGSGVRVMVPQPIRFALHKLIIAQRRKSQEAKSQKDIAQACELLDVLRSNDPDAVADAIDEARERGPTWRKMLDRGLARCSSR